MRIIDARAVWSPPWMPGITGLEVLQELKNRGSRLGAIVVTGHADIPSAVKAMQLGAVDFLEKPYEPSELLAAVERIVDAVAVQTHDATAEARRLIATLTPRECEVLRALVEGNANRTIADGLGLSTRTIEMHRASLMAKLGARTLAHTLRIAYEAGLRPHEA